MEFERNWNQDAKADAGKYRSTLVPMQIIKDIAQVREYGLKKYKEEDNWKQVDVRRYIDAIGRHYIEMLSDPLSKDAESGIEHYKHVACNISFLCELFKGEK